MKKGLLGVGIIAAVASMEVLLHLEKRKRLHLLIIVQTGKQMASGMNISRSLTKNILILKLRFKPLRTMLGKSRHG